MTAISSQIWAAAAHASAVVFVLFALLWFSSYSRLISLQVNDSVGDPKNDFLKDFYLYIDRGLIDFSFGYSTYNADKAEIAERQDGKPEIDLSSRFEWVNNDNVFSVGWPDNRLGFDFSILRRGPSTAPTRANDAAIHAPLLGTSVSCTLPLWAPLPLTAILPGLWIRSRWRRRAVHLRPTFQRFATLTCSAVYRAALITSSLVLLVSAMELPVSFWRHTEASLWRAWRRSS